MPATETQFALIRFERGMTKATILAVGTEPSIMALHTETPVNGLQFYSVRPVDHEMTVAAAEQMAARLTPSQRQALADLETDRRTTGRRVVRPGYQMRGPAPWRGMDSYNLNRITQSAKFDRLIRVTGVPYGPKTYRLTSVGRAVATAVLKEQS